MTQSQAEPRIERTHWPNGQLQSETPYIGDKINGVVRRWHENGALQSETPMTNSANHGLSREWNSDGQLRSTGDFSHGAGVLRTWHADGQLHGEIWIKDEVPHGRLRSWDEEGELIVEQFFISGRKVSKKRYFESCEQDESLPRFDPNDSPPTWAELYPETPISAPAPSEAEYNDAQDAIEWLRKSSTDCLRTLGELPSAEESVQLVEDFLANGVARVLVVNIQLDDDLENTGELLVELPKTGSARKRALKFCNEQNQACGFCAVTDTGQRFVHVALD